MEKRRGILFFIFFILVGLFLVYGLSSAFNIIEKSIFDTRAVQQTASVSIVMTGIAESLNVQVPVSGNATFIDSIARKIPLITGLNSSWLLNITLYPDGGLTPSGWQAPTSSEVKSVLRYFEIGVVNASTNGTLGGSYQIYFNITQSLLGTNVPQNISLYTFNGSGWSNLSTSIVRGTSDPAEFYGVTTHFSRFLIGAYPDSSPGQPLPSETPAGGTSGGGGGTGVKAEKLQLESIKLDREAIKIELVQDSTTSEFLKIENDGTTKLKVIIKIEPVLNFVSVEGSLKEYSLEIDSLEKRNVEFTFNGKGLAEGIYVTKAVITTGKITKVVPIVIEVVGKEKALFDVDINIPDKYLSVKPGDSINANVILFNMGALGKIKINIEYKILDLEGNVVVQEEEEVEVETQLQKMKSLKLPLFLKTGKYVFAVEARYFDGVKERVSSASSIFEVSDKPALEIPGTFGLGLSQPWILFIVLILSVISIILLIQFRVLDTLNKIRATNKAEIEDLQEKQNIKEKTNSTNMKLLAVNTKRDKPPGRKEELASIIEEIRKRMR